MHSVHAYIVDKAELVLREQYPATNDSDPVAVVKLAAVLENLGQDIVQVGSWVNVVGNVRAHSNDRTARGARTSVTTVVDATMIWSAGAIKPDKYRTAVLEYQKPLQNG